MRLRFQFLKPFWRSFVHAYHVLACGCIYSSTTTTINMGQINQRRNSIEDAQTWENIVKPLRLGAPRLSIYPSHDIPRIRDKSPCLLLLASGSPSMVYTFTLPLCAFTSNLSPAQLASPSLYNEMSPTKQRWIFCSSFCIPIRWVMSSEILTEPFLAWIVKSPSNVPGRPTVTEPLCPVALRWKGFLIPEVCISTLRFWKMWATSVLYNINPFGSTYQFDGDGAVMRSNVQCCTLLEIYFLTIWSLWISH